MKTLGVLPVLIDAATIEYSNRDGLAALLEETSWEVADWLIEDLREKGDYFDVRRVEGDREQLLAQIIAGREVVGEGAASHHRYQFNPVAISELTERSLADAVLVVIINGIERPEKRWHTHSTRLEYLESAYRSLLYTAAVVTPPSEQLWVRPAASGDFLMHLDYPDFDEAYWNMTDEVKVKEITLPGLQSRLAEFDQGLFVKTAIPKKYDQMINDLVDQLKRGF
ncbi:MAG: hypothetical protein C0615_11985 [Desulfuromonas sp.]|nr:MAG: hypothetical protein C0615_11985 [Desulfuromonas sp.]